jgi:hypothetical protein
MHLNQSTIANPADGNLAPLPPKKPKKVYRTEFVTAHRACQTDADREQLALIVKAQWTEAELAEYARIYYFKDGKDYPTAWAYRRAIADLSKDYYAALTRRRVKPSDHPKWLKEFRDSGSVPIPPRREALLTRGRGNGPDVGPDEYAWPEHSEEFRSMIEQRCRAYFTDIPANQPIPPNAWAASLRWYRREQAEAAAAAREAARLATEAVALVLSPKAKRRLAKRADREDRTSFEYCEEGRRGYKPPRFTREVQAEWLAGVNLPPPYELIGKLKPHFSYHFEGHTPEFREQVAALARKDHGLRPNAKVSPTRWKAACYKNFILIERPQN